ncbi:MAG: CBS domain-containing protein [Pseudomonadota bacterium]
MPTSYRGGSADRDTGADKTYSQTTATNTVQDRTTVGQLLSSKSSAGVISIGPDDTIADAVGVLRDKRIGALVVTDAGGALCGILSERDIVRKLAETPGQTLPQSVADNMTTKVETCAADDLLEDVLRRMIAGRFRHMPVMDGAQVAGMITIGDAVNHRLMQLEHETLQLKQMIVG